MAGARARTLALPLLVLLCWLSSTAASASIARTEIGSSLGTLATTAVNFSGELIGLGTTSTGLDGNFQGNYFVTRGGGEVTVVVTAQTKLANQGNSLQVTQLVIGDRLEVQGNDDSSTNTITATKITVVPFPTVNFTGALIAVGASATSLDGSVEGSYSVTRANSTVTVVVTSQTQLANQGNSLPVSGLVVGDHLQVQGSDNTATNTVTATKITVAPFPKVSFAGEVVAVNGAASVTAGTVGGSYSVARGNSTVTVVVSAQTVLANQGNSLPVSGLVVGERLEVQGGNNTATNTITATKITVVPFPAVNFSGELIGLGTTSTGLDGNFQGNYFVTRGGGEVTVVVTAQTKLANQGNSLQVTQLVIGDRLEVQGNDDSSTNTITATKITVVPFPTVNFTGALIAVGTSATSLDGSVEGSYSVTRANSTVTVVVTSQTQLANQGNSLPVSGLVVGDHLQVQGSDNTATNTVTATKITVAPFPKVSFAGEVVAVNGAASVTAGTVGGSYSVARGNSTVTVVVSAQTVLANQGNSLPVSGLVVGERLEVQGGNNTATNTITATKITVVPFPAVNFSGELIGLGTTSTGLDGNFQGNYFVTRGGGEVTVVVTAQTKLANQGNSLQVTQLVIGDRLEVQGNDDSSTNTITATKITVVQTPRAASGASGPR